MNSLITLFTDYTFQMVALGTSILGMISGALGCFVILRKQSLLGDGIAHSALPGILLVFLLTGNKQTILLLLGAFLSGLLATGIILIITKYSPIKFDSALAITLAIFFGFAMVLLTIEQKTPNSNQAGLDRFLYGQASALLSSDVIIILICGISIVTLLLLFWKELKLITFDMEFARTVGIPTTALYLMLTFMIVTCIIIGLQGVGVILMSSMLIAPGVSARQWVSSLRSMVLLASFFGGICGFIGTIISSLIPNVPTGPIVVICMSILFLISFLFAPYNGLLAKLYRRYSYTRKCCNHLQPPI